MALVTVTYQAWDHNRQVVPAAQMPEVWFRPIRSSLANGLMTDRPVKGTLNSDGSGTVQLESAPDLLYVPFMRWLLDKNVPDAHEYCEWPAIHPGKGGEISELQPAVGLAGVLVGFGPPPEQFSNLVYLDISGPDIQVYGPAGGNV